ncbi:MAG: hypothetical protein AAB498_00155 [Patescibacteria group bacterium]
MKENQNAKTLSDSEVKQISSTSIRGWDKWNRMYAGIASNLEKYENDIIYLRIENTEKTFPSSYETAIRFTHSWINGNEELRQAKGFVVSFYKCKFTGFAIAGPDAVDNPDLFKTLVEKIQSASQLEKELVSIHSGLLAFREWENGDSHITE